MTLRSLYCVFVCFSVYTLFLPLAVCLQRVYCCSILVWIFVSILVDSSYVVSGCSDYHVDVVAFNRWTVRKSAPDVCHTEVEGVLYDEILNV